MFEAAAAATTIEDQKRLVKEADMYIIKTDSSFLGVTERDRLAVVAPTVRGDGLRLISARPATAKERRGYEEGT